MDKNKAISSIEETFDSSFNKDKFILFIKNLLNDIDLSRYREYRGNLIKEAFREYISQYYRIGKYTDPNGHELDVLIIEVKNETKLERARTSLRNFVINHLNTFDKEYALAAFYTKTDNGRNWRFSFIKLEHQTFVKGGKIKQQKDLTPAKRYSFLVGEDEKCHTAKRQLLPLLQNVYNNPLIEDLENAFSIEVVTDEFFEQYKDLFIRLSEALEENTHLVRILTSSEVDIPRFTKKLLGQIVFLYFLQKKGWLGVPKNGNWGDGQKNFLQGLYKKAESEEKNFFRDYLQYLFYEALARQHGKDNYYARFDCRIPFLNGGLFEADYDWKDANVRLPNELFRNQDKVKKTGDIGTGVLDVFDRYNFTIREDEPLEKEVAVDPEMLGKVFENMLEITERKSKGAFYTPREIVHYMCQESLIHYLDNAINKNTSIHIPKEEIEDFVHNGILTVENDALISEKERETYTYKYKLSENIREHADTIDHLITNIKICDPAIGSGAFPVGLLSELVTLQQVLKGHLSENYLKEKLNVIGLDDFEYEKTPEKYIYRIKRHNIQESIYGVDIDPSAIDIARLRLWLSLVVDEEDFDNIEALPNLDYKIVCGNSLIGFPENWNSPAFQKIEKLKDLFFKEIDAIEKKKLKKEIDKEMNDRLSSSLQVFGYKVDFDFKLFFSEVWREKGGFDIVIGNPPYDVYEGKKADEIPTIKKIDIYNIAKSGKLNAYKLFLSKSIRLLNQGGIFNQIFQNSFLGDNSAKLLRKYFLTQQRILKIDSFPERDDLNKRVFKSAKMSVCILFSQNKTQMDEYEFPLFIWSERGMINSYNAIFSNKELLCLDKESFVIPSVSQFEKSILNKVYRFDRLGSIINCYQGEINLSTNKSIIVQKPTSNTMPLIKGAGVQKWYLPEKMSQGIVEYLIYKDYLAQNKGEKNTHFNFSRIVMQGITGVDEKHRIKATILPKGVFCGHSINYISLKGISEFKSMYYLALLNSEFSNWFFKKFSTNSNVNSYEIHNLPCPEFVEQYSPLSILSSFLLNNKRKLNGITFDFIEQVINSIIYEIVFPEEIHSANKGVIEYLQDVYPIDDSMSDQEKISIINSEFERLYDPYHPVRNNVDTIENIEVVRIIKEALRK